MVAMVSQCDLWARNDGRKLSGTVGSVRLAQDPWECAIVSSKKLGFALHYES